MERKLNAIVQNYVAKFKSDTVKYAQSLNAAGDNKVDAVLQFVCDYDRLIFTADDFAKRQRIKHVVSPELRCNGKRGAGNQCTRRKQEGKEYCGTHAKVNYAATNSPVLCQDSSASATETLEVWTEEINGIMYYIDKKGNIYDASDVVCNKLSPKVLGKYTKSTGELVWH
jgi:hypothetical protein